MKISPNPNTNIAASVRRSFSEVVIENNSGLRGGRRPKPKLCYFDLEREGDNHSATGHKRSFLITFGKGTRLQIARMILMMRASELPCVSERE